MYNSMQFDSDCRLSVHRARVIFMRQQATGPAAAAAAAAAVAAVVSGFVRRSLAWDWSPGRRCEENSHRSMLRRPAARASATRRDAC